MCQPEPRGACWGNMPMSQGVHGLRCLAGSAASFEQRFGHLDTPRLTFLRRPVVVPLRQHIGDTPIRHSRFADSARPADSPCPAQCLDEFIDRLDHAAEHSPSCLDLSNVFSFGRAYARRRDRLRPMTTAITDAAAISARIRQLRQQKGWTQVTAAKACGVTRGAWWNYENGYRPDIDQADAIADVFGVTLDYIYKGSTAGLSAEAIGRIFGVRA